MFSNNPNSQSFRQLIVWLLTLSICFITIACSKEESAVESSPCFQELLSTRDYSADIQKKLNQAIKIHDYQEKMSIYNEVVTYLKTAHPADIICFSDIMLELAEREGSIKGQAIAMSRKALGSALVSNFAEAEKALNKASILGDSCQFIPVVAESENQLSYICYVSGKLKEGILHGKKALNLLKSINDTINIPSAQINLANSYNAAGEYEEATHYYLLALDGEQKIGNQVNILSVNTNIGISYLAQENYDQAKSYATTALGIANQIGANVYLAKNNMILATIALAKEEVDSAIYWYKECLKLKGALAQSPADLALVYSGMGEAYLAKGMIQKSLALNQQALEIAKSLSKFSFLLIPIHARLGMAYMQQNNFEEAQANFDTVLNMANEGQLLEHKREVYNKIAEAYERQGNIDKAYEYYQKFHEAHNLLFNQRRAAKIATLQEEFEKEAREQEIVHQKQQTLLEKKRKQFFQIASTLILLLLILASYYWWRDYKNKKRINNLYEEIQHRIKNHLSFITDFLEPLKINAQHTAAQQIISEGQRRVEAIGMLYQKLYQTNKKAQDHDIELDAYLMELTDYLAFSVGKDKQMAISLKTDPIKMDIGKAMYIGLLTNELVTNACKHAASKEQEGHVLVQLKNHEKGLYFSVEDNGPGLPPLQEIEQKDSIGWRLIHVLGKQLNGSPSIKNNPGMKYELLIKT